MTDDQDKSEKPTPQRLKQAHDRGEVAKSAEFTGWLVMATFATAIAVTAASVAEAVVTATRTTLQLSGARPTVSAELPELLSSLAAPIGQSLLPAAMAIIVVAVVANLAQTGGVLTSHPLKPDFDRMNPSKAIKRIFSIQTLFEFAKLTLKFAVLGGIAWWGYLKLDHIVAAIAQSQASELAPTVGRGFLTTSLFVLVPLGVLALVDLLFVRHQHLRKLRMSRREVKDEIKQREGDPEIRSKRKRLLRDLLKRSQSSGGAAGADVVVTNPTHIAVALRYRPKEMRAPVVVAKGAGRFAARIRRECAAAGVPMLRRPELARRLFRECEVNQPISSAAYRDVAPLYRWLMSQPDQKIFT